LEPSKKKQPNAYLKYSNMAFQMVIPIILGVWAGKTLDEKYQTKNIWTVVLALIGVFMGMYLALKDFIKPKNE
jgi:F0F1-type ATP synthase assembly protein I